jgi:hypothetical protein
VFGILRKLLRKREKPRVFLGTLVVVPRADIKRRFEQWWSSHYQELETPLRSTLREIFSLPLASEVSDPLPTDLGLDVFIPSFQSGDALGVSLADLEIPVFWIFLWRPKVTVTCRLYSLRSQETKFVYSVTQKMPWREYFGRLFTLPALFRSRPMFSVEDLNHLLNLACHSLLNRLTKAI